jgi:Carbohydrate/starch-binding module (family 21)
MVSLELNRSVPVRKLSLKIRMPSLYLSKAYIKSGILRSSQKKMNKKKSLTFSPTIETVCHFAKFTPANNISKLDRTNIPDCGDYDLPSISSSFLIPQFWSIRSKSSSCLTQFQNIVLDTVNVSHGKMLRLSVLVRNIAYEKNVTMRFTWDAWETYEDVQATYDMSVAPDMDGYTGLDRFTITMDLNTHNFEITSTAQMDFAFRYIAAGEEYWDNNGSENHKVSKSDEDLL